MMEHVYKSTDIKWVKNVKRDGGSQWAYNEYELGVLFFLNWSGHYGKNVYAPLAGEIILLIQTVKGDANVKDGTYLTHLVTPIDNELYPDKNSISHPNTRLVRVIGKANTVISSSSNLFNFSKVSRGLCYKIELMGSKKYSAPRTKLTNQRTVWNLFNSKSIEKIDFILSADNNYGAWEGAQGKEIIKHKYYERDRKIILMAKSQAASLKCEACKFDFNETYPGLGKDFIECHHKIPIGKGIERWTTIDDLALVCSNCHRMLHRKYKGRYFSVEGLAEFIRGFEKKLIS